VLTDEEIRSEMASTPNFQLPTAKQNAD
jgi:hypothetical protein